MNAVIWASFTLHDKYNAELCEQHGLGILSTVFYLSDVVQQFHLQ